jgi:serine/threonine-protein kinase RsbW
MGAPRVGKTELLRKCFDLLFNENQEVAPFYYSLKAYCLDVDRFARDYLSQFLAQFIAFRRNEPRLIAIADEPLASIARSAPPADYLWMRAIVDSFARAAQAGDSSMLLRCALSAPATASSHTGLGSFILVDNFHLLADRGSPASLLRSEFVRVFAAHESLASSIGSTVAHVPTYALAGLRRPVVEVMPADEELFRGLDLIRIEPMAEELLEKVIHSTAARLGVEMSDSTVELMIQQVKGDLFYIHALLESAASVHGSLRTFMEFERVYTDEVLSGRICHYLGAVMRDVAPDARSGRAALEALSLVTEANAAVPLETVTELMGEYTSEGGQVLAGMHARELLEISYGFVNASNDSVLADYVRAKYRSEVAGAPRPVAGDDLLGEKLKHSYRLMMSRYNRAVESQLVESLSRFDFQSVPASLFSEQAFEKAYRGMSRVHVRRALDEEKERVRLPQIVLVNEAGSGEQPGMSWRLFASSGFEGGIYSEANEVLWLIAVVNSKEALDLETVTRIEPKLKAAGRGMRGSAAGSHAVHWYISKEGFSLDASERLASAKAYCSTYSQLDLLQDHLIKLGLGEVRRPASEFELVIPIEDEAELIAARTVEQVARAADFDQEAINQIKTALIEACINASEHSDSPDRRIHQRFAVDEDRLVITVSNKGRSIGPTESGSGATAPAGSLKGTRGRGLQIIRALMDEVRFQPTDDGTSLVMIKYLKSPTSREE